MMKNLFDFGIETKIHYPIPHFECAYNLTTRLVTYLMLNFCKINGEFTYISELKDLELDFIVINLMIFIKI